MAMATAGTIDIKPFIMLGLTLVFGAADSALHNAAGGRCILEATADAAVKVYDARKYGAKGDDRTDNTMAFMKAWKAACKTSANPAKLLVPEGTFVTAPVVFQGPCKSSEPIIVEVQGTVKATSDLSQYTEDSWFLFERINGLVLTGGGTFDGQGDAVWQYNDCKTNKDCVRLPSSIKVINVNNSVVYNIKSVNSKFFHFHVTDCNSFMAYNLNIVAPDESPNTDGLHISDSHQVNVSNSFIGTGDDCISIGQGVTDAVVTKIFCGPGHGLSIGSLGRRENEREVNGIMMKNCTLFNTTNGVRIKTFSDSPPGIATGIRFEDIIMDKVKNPIIIDQRYGSRKGKAELNSKVKVSDVRYKNIRGTTTSNVAVNLLCSSRVPCEGIELVDIDLAYKGTSEKNKTISSSCSNAKVQYSGKHNPPACE